ncbi:MAG: molybdopterin molybdenumtransferase MoeA, partial [Deltaproteobacteria bacterium]
VMIEYCHTLDEDTIEVSKSVSPLENVISPGDDVRSGQPVLRRGRHLRPQDIGLLAGLGISRVEVTRRAKIAIISTGDEVVDIHTRPLPGQVRDVNRYSLSAFCQALGAVPFAMGRCKDEFEALKEKIGQGLEVADSVWISGGSSVGTRDLTLKVFQALGEFELLVHGISISPGKPTIIGRVRGKPVIGLPGHISSALVVAEVFLAPFLARLSGLEQDQEPFGGRVTAEMSRNVESASGRDDYLRVRLVRQGDRLKAEPIFGKSGLISPLVEGHGLVRIHRNKEGLYEGEQVEVRLFEWMPFFMDGAS